jgi:hypothetical protein
LNITGTADQAGIDAVSGARNTIPYEHHEIHGGSAYFVLDVVDLAINNIRDIQITTPDTTKWAHWLFDFKTENETDWYFYENVTINTAGTAHVALNADRNSANTSGLTIKYIDNTSLANANADTAVAGATTLLHGISGAGRDGGVQDRGMEKILKQNEDYSIRFIASAAGHITYHLVWYEHTSR